MVIIKEFLKIKLVVIIPLHNETLELVMRAVNHYNDKNRIIYLLDSSEDSLGIKSDEYVKYLHLPKVSFLVKIYECLKLITSDFILLSPVDDYCFIDEILPYHSDILNSDRFAYLGGNYSIFNNYDEINFKKTPIDIRINLVNHKEIFGNYTFPLLWGIYSQATFQSLLEKLVKYKFQNDNFIELGFIALLPSIGRVYFTNIVFFYREIRDNSWGRKHKRHNIIDLLLLKIDQREYFRLMHENSLIKLMFFPYIFYLTKGPLREIVVNLMKRVRYTI